MKVVIIGGVAAGATTAARLRRLNKDVEIIMFEKGNYVSYANCGLPYYVSGEIRKKSDLLLMTPELFKERFQVDVRVGSEVKAIDPDNQTVAVYNHITEKTYQESYDQLVIATGSAPIRLPIPGIDHPDIQQLWTIEDFVKIRQMVELKNIQTACIIGGGFVGIETAENLRELKVDVDVVEKGAQILNNLDFEMVQPIHKYLNKKGVHLYLNTELMAFEDDHSKIQVKTDAFTKSYDLVILSVGVKPQSELAKQAGIACNQRGGIIVDEHLMTNIPHIYAVGDVIEVEHYINHQKTMIPLAGPANKEGRILANHLMGANESYQGSLGSSIIKVFKMAAASTGFNEKQLQAQGLKRHQDYEVIIIQQKSHAGYYPGATPLTIKAIYDLQQKILGAQVVGYEGVDKRIDVISTAIHYHGKVTDLKDIHIAYAPPFASAKDAVNMVGYVAENIQNGYVKLMLPDEYQQQKDQVITLDVREDEERQAGYIEGSYHIPYGELTKRYQELDTNQTIVIYCAVGVRAYNCARILMQRGYQKVYVLSGGIGFYLDYSKKLYMSF